MWEDNKWDEQKKKKKKKVSLWRSFVTTELASLLGLKNRYGHWLCWMSTGKKNGLV